MQTLQFTGRQVSNFFSDNDTRTLGRDVDTVEEELQDCRKHDLIFHLLEEK